MVHGPDGQSKGLRKDKMKKIDEGWELKVKDFILDVSGDDWSTILSLKHDRVKYELRIESSTSVIHSGGSQEVFEPGLHLARSEVGRALSESSVRSLTVSDNGSLGLELFDGTSIKVQGSNEYEPWALTGPDGLKIVSTSAQSLSVWEPE